MVVPYVSTNFDIYFRKKFLENVVLNPAVITIKFCDGVMFISSDGVMGTAVVITAKE